MIEGLNVVFTVFSILSFGLEITFMGVIKYETLVSYHDKLPGMNMDGLLVVFQKNVSIIHSS